MDRPVFLKVLSILVDFFQSADSLWTKKGGLLKKGKSLQKAVFSVNNPEPLAVMDDGK